MSEPQWSRSSKFPGILKGVYSQRLPSTLEAGLVLSYTVTFSTGPLGGVRLPLLEDLTQNAVPG